MDICCIIPQALHGERLDCALCRLFEGFSRSYFQQLIVERHVTVNGLWKKKREKVSLGDQVEVAFVYSQELSVEPEDLPIEVLYEDEWIIAVNKTDEMVIHPAPGHHSGTLVNALLYRWNLTDQKGENNLRPGIVHRLDKHTSGVVLVAKTLQMHGQLAELFRRREIEKTYVALCRGEPKDQTIHLPIGRHPIKRKEMAIVEGGRPSTTHITVQKRVGEHTLVVAKPVTGRTHQIRVHLKAIGHPIIGDPTYGIAVINHKYALYKQRLHAHRIRFMHPVTDKIVEVTASLPVWAEK